MEWQWHRCRSQRADQSDLHVGRTYKCRRPKLQSRELQRQRTSVRLADGEVTPRLPVNALGVVQWLKLFGLSGMTREELSHRPAKPLLTRFLNGEGTDVSSVSRLVSYATANGRWTKAEAITTSESILKDCES